jgi:hypothetical protein
MVPPRTATLSYLRLVPWPPSAPPLPSVAVVMPRHTRMACSTDPARSVRVSPVFTTSTGDRVPTIYVDPHLDAVQVCHRRSVCVVLLLQHGRQILLSYYDYRRGIRFEVEHMYRREGPGAWGYRIDLHFSIWSTGTIGKRWNLFVVSHYVALWLEFHPWRSDLKSECFHSNRYS